MKLKAVIRFEDPSSGTADIDLECSQDEFLALMRVVKVKKRSWLSSFLKLFDQGPFVLTRPPTPPMPPRKIDR